MKQKKVVEKKVAAPQRSEATLGKWPLVLIAGVIAIFTYLSFSPVLENSFLNWDDNAYVFENVHLSKSLPKAVAFFFAPHYFIGNYIPVTMITYAVEFHLAELDPEFFHKVNLLIHAANVLLVFWFIWLLSGRRLWVAVIVSLFFGVHPMHVESVAWIAELKDVLYTLFFIAGLIAYYKYLEGKDKPDVAGKDNIRLLLAAFGLFVLSTLSKPAAVTFPVVLLLLDFYSRRKFDKWAWIEKLPFFIVSVFFGVVAIKSQQADRLIHDYYPLWQRFVFASHSLLVYIGKFFLPVKLSIFYPYPQLENGHLPYFYYVTPVIVAALFFGVYRTLKQTRLVAFGFLFFFVNIALVLQLLSVGDAIMADRYTYIPYIGLLFVVAMGFDQFYRSTEQKFQPYRSAAAILLVVLAMGCSMVTYARCKVWKDDDSIATDLLDKFPNDRLALNNKGFILFNQKKYEEAIPLFTKAVRLKPDYVMAYINLVNAYLALRDQDNAMRVADSALKYAPGNHHVLNVKGYLFMIRNDYAEAVKYYERAVAAKKDNIDGYLYLAQCYYTLKDSIGNIRTLNTGLRYAPDNYILLNNKGYSLFLAGRYKEAAEYYKASLKIRPDYDIATVNLQNCYKALDSVNAKR